MIMIDKDGEEWDLGTPLDVAQIAADPLPTK